ncbi:MAG: extracellular solute-binding protein [Propionibacteriaceae bacterium]|jgi:N,N'-diacetylchitobiose transport system substrate-binding protein|nr:extracellular solute-binding protein [Propionibacteriaceae bacterium]
MKRIQRAVALAALATATALTLSACSSDNPNPSDSTGGQNITLWLAGGDTPDSLRDWLKAEYNSRTGGTLTIEEQAWGDLVTKLTTSLPDANNTPDVVELGNTQSPTFTNVGAFSDISDLYNELGGANLLQSFVAAGLVDGKNYTLPYYFGSRYMFYRKDVYAAAGIALPATLDEFNQSVVRLTQDNPNGIADFSGFFIGGQDWRNGISWIFANGGDLAKQENGEWVMTLSDPNTIKGLRQLQEIYQNASKAPSTAKDESPWLYINDSDSAVEKAADGSETTLTTSLAAATIMAPGWAHWSIGDLVTVDGKPGRQWNDDVFGVFALPGNDGQPAPVFAGGSNIGISAASRNQEGARELLRIIFSADYQRMLGEQGLGPANSQYVSSLGSDQFAQALIASAANSKLTPAAPGWATIEGGLHMETFFSRIAQGEDVVALAAEYDTLLTPLLNPL